MGRRGRGPKGEGELTQHGCNLFLRSTMEGVKEWSVKTFVENIRNFAVTLNANVCIDPEPRK